MKHSLRNKEIISNRNVPSDGICDLLAMGKLEKVKINSITFSDARTLMIQIDKIIHKLPKTLIVDNQINLTSKQVLTMSMADFLKDYPIKDIDPEYVDMFYYIVGQHSYKNILVVFYNIWEYMFDDRKKKLMHKYYRHTNPYSVIGNRFSRISKGYVISKGLMEYRFNYVLYDVTFHENLQTPKNLTGCNVYDFASTESELNDWQFYAMERATSSSEMLLRKRLENERNNQNHFFHSIPNGFIHEKKMYLFDSKLACVYIIEWVEMENLFKQYETGQVKYVVKRTNVPYERFFQCSNVNLDQIKNKYSNNRCEKGFNRFTVNDDDQDDKVTTINPKITFYEALPWFLIGVIIILFICFLLFKKMILLTKIKQDVQNKASKTDQESKKHKARTKRNKHKQNDLSPNKVKSNKLSKIQDNATFPSEEQSFSSEEQQLDGNEQISKIRKIKVESKQAKRNVKVSLNDYNKSISSNEKSSSSEEQQSEPIRSKSKILKTKKDKEIIKNAKQNKKISNNRPITKPSEHKDPPLTTMSEMRSQSTSEDIETE